MKNKYKLNSLILITVMMMQACCSKEFIAGDVSANISFRDKTSGYDLLFGEHKLYNKDSIFVSYDNDTSFHKVIIPENSTDTFVNIIFNNSKTCFIKFSNNDVDTFTMQYVEGIAKSAKGICRQSYNQMVSLKYNNEPLKISQDPILVFKNQ